ncbi:transcriptional regulator [Salmonella enterica]|nr:transcriptional regulator [Salmonella enterica]EGM2345358.1 transcriptional regulator [Salmonella enterica]EGM2363699.1 transcriptional regulator [Salmonella enterica]
MKKYQRCCALEAGTVPADQFWLLVEISSIHSNRIINALHDYLVDGDSRKIICGRYNVNNGYFSVCLKRLVDVHKIVIELVPFYKDFDMYEF